MKRLGLVNTLIRGALACGLVILTGCETIYKSVSQNESSLDLLVFAPHPDDEVIGCAGVMMQAIEEKKQVGVVVFTNGDGFPKGTVAITGKSRDELTSKDFLDLAALRQGQSYKGLEHLGVPTSNLTFLSYPDGGLEKIYHAEKKSPYLQKYTGKNETYSLAARDYHSLKYGKPAPYTKDSIMSDLVEIMVTRQPKEIFVTHELDTHSDHRAALLFVRDAALAAGYRGTIYTFIVHGRDPPATFVRRVALSPAQVEIKKAAIREHKIPKVHDTLDSHATGEEVFWPIRMK